MVLNRTLIVSAILAGIASPALAHTGHGGEGFAAGFAHPISGLDHLLAMAAVGLWAVQQQNGQQNARRAFILLPGAFVLPLTFIVAMALGFGLAFAGIALPVVETGIALSVLVLGLLVAFAAKPPLAAAAALTAVFALFHGHAHGSELPQAEMAAAYAVGMVLATALLHGSGLVAARLAQQAARPALTRAAGLGVALTGLVILVG